MSQGMALQQERVVIAQRTDLDRYCYSVAGVVGELLTELFAVYSPVIATQKAALAPLAVSFGEGLQLTNILKDVWEDAGRGCAGCRRQSKPLEALPPAHLRNSNRSWMNIWHWHMVTCVMRSDLPSCFPARSRGCASFVCGPSAWRC